MINNPRARTVSGQRNPRTEIFWDLNEIIAVKGAPKCRFSGLYFAGIAGVHFRGRRFCDFALCRFWLGFQPAEADPGGCPRRSAHPAEDRSSAALFLEPVAWLSNFFPGAI